MEMEEKEDHKKAHQCNQTIAKWQKQAGEVTSQTNESKRGPAATTTNDEPTTAQTSQDQNQSPVTNKEAEKT